MFSGRINIIDDCPIAGAVISRALSRDFTVDLRAKMPSLVDRSFDWNAGVFIIDDYIGVLSANDTIPLLRKRLKRSTRLFVVSAAMTPRRRARVLHLGATAAFGKDELDALIDELRAPMAQTAQWPLPSLCA